MGASLAKRDVLIVSQRYAPEAIGSAFYTHDLALGLRDRGYSVAVVAGEPMYPQYQRFASHSKFVRREYVDAIPVHRVRELLPRPGSAARRAASDLTFAARGLLASRRLPRGRFTISVVPGLAAVRLAAALTPPGRRHLCLVHDLTGGLARSTGLVSGRAAWGINLLESRWLGRADVVGVLTRQMADAAREIGVSSRLELLPLWLRDLGWAREAATQGAPDGMRTVLYSGVLGAKQGLDCLVDLAFRLRHESNVRVKIQGEGPKRAGLEHDARQRGLTNLDFAGLVPETELADSLRQAAVIVIPQEPQGAAYAVPSKVLNALASGRPVVATALSGSPLADLADQFPTMTVVPPRDGAALAAAVTAAIASPPDGADVLRNVEAQFSRHVVLDRIAAMIDCT